MNFQKKLQKIFFRFSKIKELRDKIDNLIYKEKFTIINSHFPHLHSFLNQNLKIPLFSHWHGAQPNNEPIKIFTIDRIFNFKIRDFSFHHLSKI